MQCYLSSVKNSIQEYFQHFFKLGIAVADANLDHEARNLQTNLLMEKLPFYDIILQLKGF